MVTADFRNAAMIALAGFVAVALVAAPGAAQPPACPSDSTSTSSGDLARNQTLTVALDLAPCQTLSVQIDASPNPWYGATFDFRVYSGTNILMEDANWSCYGSCSQSIPYGSPWVPPMRGTRGSEGLATIGLLSTPFTLDATNHYTITITKKARPGYNVGGIGFGDAGVMAPLPSTLFASIDPNEPGQFFKLTLPAQQTLIMNGIVEGSPSVGTNFMVKIYDMNQALLATPINNRDEYGRVLFSVTGVTNQTTNPVDYYVKLTAANYPIHDLVMTCGTQPGPCSDPPIRRKGFRPSTTVTYGFIGSWGPEKGCVENALAQWSSANTFSGLNVAFQPVATGSSPMMTLSKTLIGGSVAGGTTDPTLDAVVRDLPRALAGVVMPTPTPTPPPVIVVPVPKVTKPPPPTPTQIVFTPTPRPGPGLVLQTGRGGGCSVGGSDTAGSWLLAGVPLVLWLRRLRLQPAHLTRGQGK